MWVLGNRGYGVESLQEMLKEQGFFDGEIDGLYGEETQRAVALFQEREGLSITGEADDNMLMVLAMRCAVVGDRK